MASRQSLIIWTMSGEAWLQTEQTSPKLSHNRARKRRLVRAFLGKVVACLVLILCSNYGESSRRTARMPPSSLLPRTERAISIHGVFDQVEALRSSVRGCPPSSAKWLSQLSRMGRGRQTG